MLAPLSTRLPGFSPPETLLLAAGQPVRQPTKVLGGAGDSAQRTLVLEPLPVALLLRLPGLRLRSPGLLQLSGLGLGLGLPLLGPALGLQGLVAHQCAVGLFGLACRPVHLPASFPRWVYKLRYARTPGWLHPGPSGDRRVCE